MSRQRRRKEDLWLLPLALALALLAGSLGAEANAGQRDGPQRSQQKADAQLDVANKEVRPNLLDKLKNLVSECGNEAAKVVQNFMKPQRECLALVGRFHKWYFTYAALFQKARREQNQAAALLSPNDLMSIEFSKVDQELWADELQKARARAQLDGKQVSTESIETADFLFEVLQRLIVRLEAISAELGGRSGRANETKWPERNSAPAEDLKASDEFRDSVERLKRIVLKSAQGVVANELTQVSKVATLNALATHFVHSPPAPGTPLSFIAPFVCMLGMPNTPLVVGYLMNLKIRAAMELIDGYNPVPKVVNKLSSGIRG